MLLPLRYVPHTSFLDLVTYVPTHHSIFTYNFTLDGDLTPHHTYVVPCYARYILRYVRFTRFTPFGWLQFVFTVPVRLPGLWLPRVTVVVRSLRTIYAHTRCHLQFTHTTPPHPTSPTHPVLRLLHRVVGLCPDTPTLSPDTFYYATRLPPHLGYASRTTHCGPVDSCSTPFYSPRATCGYLYALRTVYCRTAFCCVRYALRSHVCQHLMPLHHTYLDSTLISTFTRYPLPPARLHVAPFVYHRSVVYTIPVVYSTAVRYDLRYVCSVLLMHGTSTYICHIPRYLTTFDLRSHVRCVDLFVTLRYTRTAAIRFYVDSFPIVTLEPHDTALLPFYLHLVVVLPTASPTPTLHTVGDTPLR